MEYSFVIETTHSVKKGNRNNKIIGKTRTNNKNSLKRGNHGLKSLFLYFAFNSRQYETFGPSILLDVLLRRSLTPAYNTPPSVPMVKAGDHYISRPQLIDRSSEILSYCFKSLNTSRIHELKSEITGLTLLGFLAGRSLSLHSA